MHLVNYKCHCASHDLARCDITVLCGIAAEGNSALCHLAPIFKTSDLSYELRVNEVCLLYEMRDKLSPALSRRRFR
jgi:hypothetical protein